MSVEPLTTGTPVRAPRAPHAPRPVRTTHPRQHRLNRPGAVPSRARLAALPAARSSAPRTPFVLLIVVLLGLGLLALLLLNTASAQDAFRLSDLQRQSKALADQEQSLSRQAADLGDPSNVAAAAQRLGMVPGAVPIFLAPGQKVPAGQIIDGMVIVSAPRVSPPASTARVKPAPAAPRAATKAPKAKATKPSTSSPTSAAGAKTAATTGKAVSPAVVQAMRNFANFQRLANYIKTHPQAAKGMTSPGTHP